MDTVKEANRQKFQRTDRGQDHGTRGTGIRDRSTVVMQAEDKKKQRESEEKALVYEHFTDQPELVNATENIEIKRRIRQRIKKMVAESVSQWRSIWGENQYKLKDAFFPIDSVFKRCQKEEATVFYTYQYQNQTLRIRPSELKLYKKLLRQYPAKDKDGNILDQLSESGRRELILQLAALDSYKANGVSPLPMERSFIAKQVRAEMKRVGSKKEQNANFSDFEDEEEVMIDQVEELPDPQDNWRPLTREEREEARRVRKEKYFGSR